jgi:hypothetical protein
MHTYSVGDRVYRWWYAFEDSATPQPLTVIRVNRMTLTVETDQGSRFRIETKDIAGYWTESDQ